MPLLSHSRIDNKNIPKVLSLLNELSETLQQLDGDHVWLKPDLLSYVFFPLTSIISRNGLPNIPDQILENIMLVLRLLFSWWWWTCDIALWEQMLMLAGSVVGGLDVKGKNRERDDETKTAAVKVILCLLEEHSVDDGGKNEKRTVVKSRLEELRSHAQTPKLVPILGQILNTLLVTATSAHTSLQLCSLQAINVIVSHYISDGIVPSILPGIVSTGSRIALGRTNNPLKGKGWVNGSVVYAALQVLEVGILRAIGDEPCIKAGLVKELNGLEDLTELMSKDAAVLSSAQSETPGNPFETIRTSSWLGATSSQLHIALNSLSPLLSHPTPISLIGLSSLSKSILHEAHLTLPDSAPLLSSYLLSLSASKFPSVSEHSRKSLQLLLSPSTRGSAALRQTLYHHNAECLSALPIAISSRSDAKIIHLASQVKASCSLPNSNAGIGRLLGPTGHIEKWGFRLLSVLNFTEPTIVYNNGNANLLLENGLTEQIDFPQAILRDIGTREPQDTLEVMLRDMGVAGGETCLFAVEWFVRTGLSDRGSSNSVASLWCACRILEGAIDIHLNDVGDINIKPQYRSMGKRFEKFARWVTNTISELWDKGDGDNEEEPIARPSEDEEKPLIEFSKGLNPLETRFDLVSSASKQSLRRDYQPELHKCFSLQLLAVCAEILRSRFTPLLIYALYPVLHSLVQPLVYVNGSAFASLQHITRSLGFASPGNLLLANFDYALDGAARRLTKRRLDVDAARVLTLLVRIVGRDIVHRAGDVVEECFDRLDDFHGYTIVVEGLVEVLHEVVTVVADMEEFPVENLSNIRDEKDDTSDKGHFKGLIHWLKTRHDAPTSNEEESDEIGPSPRKAFGEEVKIEDDKGDSKRNDSSSALDEPPPTPTQILISQIVTRSISLLIHGSVLVRVRILTLLANAVPTLPASALLPSVHRAWPFILNRLADTQTAVVAAAASLIAALAATHGSFMTQRIWDDVWPRFKQMLSSLDAADGKNALARRSVGTGIGTESAYTHSHRLYRAMLQTIAAAVSGGVQIQDRRSWDVLLAFRRFLSKSAHDELQAAARRLYILFGEKNEDSVWLVLTSSAEMTGVPLLNYLIQKKWDIKDNVEIILQSLITPKSETI